MTREELFLAIGGMEESRLARTEMTVQPSSGREGVEETSMYKNKRKVNIVRIIRNLVAAAIIISMLGVTAYAVAGWVIFDSPEEMVSAIFGDETGFDHKPVTTWTDPEKPGSVYENPGHDRVPADETVVAEDIVPHVSPVGKTLTRDGYTLTVDAYLYDSNTSSGIVTYTLESENGIPDYEVFPTGEFWFRGADPVDFNQYGKTFLIQDKTTEESLAVTFYFHYDEVHEKDFTVALGDYVLTEEESAALQAQCDQEVREMYTPEEAIAAAKEMMGAAAFASYAGGLEEQAAYFRLASQLWHEKADGREKIVFDCSESSKLNCVTAAEGNVIITPISFQIDVEEMEFLHETIAGEPYIHADNVDEAVICYQDGTEYVVSSGDVCNVVFALGSIPKDSETGHYSRLNYLFNRIIDVEQVAFVKINGTELKLD